MPICTPRNPSKKSQEKPPPETLDSNPPSHKTEPGGLCRSARPAKSTAWSQTRLASTMRFSVIKAPTREKESCKDRWWFLCWSRRGGSERTLRQRASGQLRRHGAFRRRPTRAPPAATGNCRIARTPRRKGGKPFWRAERRHAQQPDWLPIRKRRQDPARFRTMPDSTTEQKRRSEWRAGRRDSRGCTANSGPTDTSYERCPPRDGWPARFLRRSASQRSERRGHYGCSNRKELWQARRRRQQVFHGARSCGDAESFSGTVPRPFRSCKTIVDRDARQTQFSIISQKSDAACRGNLANTRRLPQDRGAGRIGLQLSSY